MSGCIGRRKPKERDRFSNDCTGCGLEIGKNRETYGIAGVPGRFCRACHARITEGSYIRNRIFKGRDS